MLLMVFVMIAKAEVTYVINSVNCPVGGGTLSFGELSVAPTSGTVTFASANQNTIKWSNGRSYTITLPATSKVTKMDFYGYGNNDGANAYIATLAGKEYDETKYVFTARDEFDNTKTDELDSYSITFDTPLTGSIEFTFKGAQAAVAITLHSEEEQTDEQKDIYSIGKYSNPATGGITPEGASKVFEWTTPVCQMEKIDRGLVALPEMNGKGIMLSWRLFGTDGLGRNSKTTFDVYRNGELIKSDLSSVTNYVDADGTRADTYYIKVKVDGEVTETTASVTPWGRIYKTIQLDRPEGGVIASWKPYDSSTKKYGSAVSMPYEYTPNDMSVADLDGDGQYELIVKWDPSTSQDNSIRSGNSGDVYIDAYKMDGTKMWRVSLGKNIRAGAHYTQFLVYDFDGDGKAEMICKTAPGSKDGNNEYVTEAATIAAIKNSTTNEVDYRNSDGCILTGNEYLTIFNGETGAAMHTIWYVPDRGFGLTGGSAASYTSSWGDSYGGRGDRMGAAVAYLDGMDKKPSAVLQRGYYTHAFFWAVDWDGTSLSTKWIHYGNSSSSWKTYNASGVQIASGSGSSSYGQGVHGISVADVNNDGYDEIVMGSATISHDGKLLCSTGFGHGDAIHVSDLCPDREGLEIMMPHEEKNASYGYDVHDATTGEVIYRGTSSADNGRGLAADVLADNRGFEFWSSAESNVRSCIDGTSLGTKKPSTNFRIYWDGDLQDELFDGGYSETAGCSSAITKMTNAATHATLLSLGSEAYGSSQTCNTTKATPCLQADIMGDWREELILWDGTDPSVINVFSSNVPSTYAIPTLMHDHTYRMGIAWQNCGYNQPPHLGFYLPDMFDKNYGIFSDAYATGVNNVVVSEPVDNGKIYNLAGQQVDANYHGIVIQNGVKKVQ